MPDQATTDRRDEPRRGMPRALRYLLVAIVLAALVVVLFGWVFPWVEANIYNPSLEAETAPLVHHA